MYAYRVSTTSVLMEQMRDLISAAVDVILGYTVKERRRSCNTALANQNLTFQSYWTFIKSLTDNLFRKLK